MIFWEMERGGTTTVLQAHRMSLADQRCAIKLLSIWRQILLEGAFDAIHTLITDGLPTVEATCDGMRPLQASCPDHQSVASYHPVGSRHE